MTIGKCKLTHHIGTFVKSHLLPLAFTDLSEGPYFIEGGPGKRPIRRPTSWYDKELVTRRGEDILAGLDSMAASTLRASKLVWSGWGDSTQLPDDAIVYPGSEHRLRLIKGLDVQALRRFFLSILWRAAASTLSEFRNVELPDKSLEALRLMVLNGETYPLSFFPIQLVQISTKGEPHNLGPLRMRMPFDVGDGTPHLLSSYRLYFDGLIANIFFDIPDDIYSSISALYIGGDSDLVVMTIPYEKSFQYINLEQHKFEAVRDFPETLSKLLRR